jgi:hypothetical protein
MDHTGEDKFRSSCRRLSFQIHGDGGGVRMPVGRCNGGDSTVKLCPLEDAIECNETEDKLYASLRGSHQK